MLFNTPEFVLVLGAVILCRYLLPKVCRKIALLVFDFYFAFLLGGMSTIITLGTVILLTYLFGLLVGRSPSKKVWTALFLVLLTLLLFYGKYTNYLLSLLDNRWIAEEVTITVAAMVGISYYVFSAMSYVIDICRGKDRPDTNLLDVAIWLSFFAKIIAGPIERHAHFKQQLDGMKTAHFDFENVKRGLLICALGYFYKIILADRIGLFVDTVYTSLDACRGFTLLLAMLLYSLQIYFDFAGYSMIAQGVAYAMNLRICRNFDHPYFSQSVAEFWRRWHISLSSWLKDYIYIPLGGNRKGKIRQCLNVMITFLVSGVWHGAGLTYLVWGGLHGAMQIVEKQTGFRRKLSKAGNVLTTFLLVSFAWIFFRADTMRQALIFLQNMWAWNPWVLTDGTLTGLGLDLLDWGVLLIALCMAFAIEWAQMHDISLYEQLSHCGIIIRWTVFYAIILGLLIFGVYGGAYSASNFIYFQY